VPEKVCAETVPAGVIEELPPVVPTSEFAAIVPRANLPLSAVTSEKPEGQLAARVRMIPPEGKA
jgi:hypothetical protein